MKKLGLKLRQTQPRLAELISLQLPLFSGYEFGDRPDTITDASRCPIRDEMLGILQQ